MKRILVPLIFLACISALPLVTYAQSCKPGVANACASGTSCKDLTGTGQYFCASDGTGCTPSCTGGEVCVVGKCVQPTSASGSSHPITGTAVGGGAGGTAVGGGAGGTAIGGGAGNTGGSGGSGATLQNPLKFNSLPELMDAILQAVVDIGAIVLIFMLVWVGFLFVTAQGNPEKISSARSALIWTVIGGLILLGAEAISKVIEATVSSLAP